MNRLWKLWSLLYFVILLYVVFFARRRPYPTWNPRQWHFRWIPFETKWHLYTQGYEVSGIYLDILGNIIMFTPLPLFLFIVFGVRNYWKLLSSAFLFSTVIETIQYVTNIGFADIDDIIFNTIGGLLGVLIIDGVKRALDKDTIT
ncbi:hypothetical protein GCM10023231_02930 [Olivibacter ginsenosidimutans]|uniref:VanZ-like domain-containing protein n=1 Tax=Olivibacter ginsenosidimutans TaxID=1176537 RepID=A0ABP9AGY5_9SPHI